MHDLFREIGLEGLADRRPGKLSGGQQQRVAVARAVVARPDLVLADEPTANLDSVASAALLDTMQRLNQEHGTTFVFSTHDPRVMERARRRVTLVAGHVARADRRGPVRPEASERSAPVGVSGTPPSDPAARGAASKP